MDKAGKKYWNDSWFTSTLPHAMNPADMTLNNYVSRCFHVFFLKLFNGFDTRSLRLLEVGCAKSIWLPYFANEHGFEVCGLDYSPVGCEMAAKVLKANMVEAEIVCADLFSQPQSLLNSFDVIVSFGVVEHFQDTSACITAISAFLKPGGLLITSIPNMNGWIGSIQKYINKLVYDIHQLIDPIVLKDSHRAAGLTVLECDYFMITNFGVINLAGLSTSNFIGLSKRILLAFLARFSMAIWVIESKFNILKPNKLTSPYIICVARKP